MKRIFLLTVSLLYVFAAGAQQWHTAIDVLRPGAKQFPVGITDLLIVNNTVPQPADLGHAILQDGNPSAGGHADVDLAQAPLRVLFAVAERFDDSGLFASAGLYPISANSGTFFNRSYLTAEQVAQLCTDYSSDAVLALDQVVLYDRVESYLNENERYYAYLQAYGTLHWTLHWPDGRRQVFAYADTLLWDHVSSDRGKALEALPERQTALLDMAAYMGERFAAQFVPEWEKEDRWIYHTADPQLEQAFSLFTRRRFADAAALWRQAAGESSVALVRAYAAADAAVALELSDDLDNAAIWARRAAAEFGKQTFAEALQQQINMEWYADRLQERRKEKKLLLR